MYGNITAFVAREMSMRQRALYNFLCYVFTEKKKKCHALVVLLYKIFQPVNHLVEQNIEKTIHFFFFFFFWQKKYQNFRRRSEDGIQRYRRLIGGNLARVVFSKYSCSVSTSVGKTSSVLHIR